MFLSRQLLIVSLTAFIIFVVNPVEAALRYQQDLTLTTFISQEETEKMVKEFCSAAEGDPDIKVINVKYQQQKMGKGKGKGNIAYEAVITCHVAEEDASLMKIQGKIFQQKNHLITHDTNMN